MIVFSNRIHLYFFYFIAFCIWTCNSFYTPALDMLQLSKPSPTILMEGNKRAAVKFTSTREGRRLIMDRAKKYIKKASMVMAFTNFGLQKNTLDVLRKALPDGAVASVVKNGVFRRALDGTRWEPMAQNLKDNNVYLFIPEGKFREVYEAYKKWKEEFELSDDASNIKFACVEGHMYEAKDKIEEVLDIPTRKELMYRLGKVIHNIPTQLTRVLRKVPERLRQTLTMVNMKMAATQKQTGSEGENLTLQELLDKLHAQKAAAKENSAPSSAPAATLPAPPAPATTAKPQNSSPPGKSK